MSEKTDLQEKARQLGLDDAGTIADLKARIAEAEPEKADTAPIDGLAEARRSYEEFQAAEEAKLQEQRDAAAKAKVKRERDETKAKLRELRESRAEVVVDGGKEAEQASKEASVPGSDPRDSVFDAAPGKSLDDVLERNEALARGDFTDVPADPKRAQWFVVTDEADLIEVSRKLGLPDHSALGALNGRHNSVYGVQRGERIVLPAEYTFDGIEGVITEGDEDEQLAGSEASA